VLLALLGEALMLAAFRVDMPMLSGGNLQTWSGWVHGIAFLLIIAMGVLAPLAMAWRWRWRCPVMRAGDRPRWSPLLLLCPFVVFLLLPWATPSFLMTIVTVFAWITAVAVCLATYIRPKPRCAFVADEGGAVTATAL
jgi:hypothetical protein